MVSAMIRRLRNTLLPILMLTLAACGGGKEEAPPAPVCPSCPVCDATPSPSVEDLAQQLQDKLDRLVKKLRVSPESFKASAAKFGVAEKFGSKEISAEDFPKFVSFFWEVDAEFRIQYLRAMMTQNRLVEMVKPSVGKFDINVAPKDLEAEDVSLLVSQAIVDWAQVQRLLEGHFRDLGVENVAGVKPSDEMPHAEAMMQELLSIVAPPLPTPVPTPGPQATSASLLSLLIRDAHAQSATKGKTLAPTPKVSKAVPRVKVRQAPFLLARVISYNVGGKNFVLQSPLMAAIPEFQALPVEQFQFKVEKLSVGPGYRDSVDARVQALAAKPNRDMVDWWNLSNGLIELRLLNQLLDPNKVVETAPPASPSAGGDQAIPPAGDASPTSPTQRPLGGLERQSPDAATTRPSAAAPSGSLTSPETRPSTASPSQPVVPQVRPEGAPAAALSPSSAERPNTSPAAPPTAP